MAHDTCFVVAPAPLSLLSILRRDIINEILEKIVFCLPPLKN